MPAKVEYTEFDFDELSTEGDTELVVPGAVFYWTIGRAKNAAGTVINSSLLRFRRLPEPSDQYKAHARAEAERLLRDLGGPISS